MALLSTLYPQRVITALPAPLINLHGSTTVPYLSAITQAAQSSPTGHQNSTPILLNSAPTLQIKDISKEVFSQYVVGIQPVFFNKTIRRSSNSVSYRSYTMHSPKPYVDDSILNRVNNIAITENVNYVSLAPFLNNRLCKRNITYRNTAGQQDSIVCIVPIRNRERPLLGNRFPYSATYSPLYVAFRYYAINSGNVFTGPLSPTIKVANSFFPFQLDHYASSVNGAPCAKLNTDGIELFQCSFA